MMMMPHLRIVAAKHVNLRCGNTGGFKLLFKDLQVVQIGVHPVEFALEPEHAEVVSDEGVDVVTGRLGHRREAYPGVTRHRPADSFRECDARRPWS